MKNSKKLLSVIITTYNRYSLLRKAVEKIYEQSYKNIQIIVSDDCSTDNTKNIKKDFPEIEYIKTPCNLGYAGNARFALQYAKGEFIIFLSDDDHLVDNTFFEKAILIFNSNSEVDVVFGRIQIEYNNLKIVNNYKFDEFYTPYKFLQWFKKVNTNYCDYFSLSSMIFKKDIVEKIDPFHSIFDDSSTVDLSLILKYIMFSKKIKFIDTIAYSWRFPTVETLSNNSRDDLVKQAKNNLAVVYDVDNFINKYQHCFDNRLVKLAKEVLNLRVEWTFYAILSEKERLNNQKNFEKILKKIKNKKNIYIYGRGWTGLELKEFLNKKGINIKYFIDDYKKDFPDTITFNQFKNMDGNKIVIISLYKYKDIYNIYKKLNTLKNIEIYDLVS